MTALLLVGCGQQKPVENKNQTRIEIDSARDFYEQPEDKTVYDYRSFTGIYDHESTTKSFSAMLSITESGNDLSFILSVSQGTCTGKVEGRISMVSHAENYHIGFFELAECPLQFNLMTTENKIDVKEVGLCSAHKNNCAFEGTYSKRKK